MLWVGVATVLIAVVALIPAIRQAISSQEQADAAKEQNDRTAGRTGAKAAIIELLPKLEEMSHLLRPADERLPDAHTKKPAEFVFFKDVHSLCSVNPRIRVKNTGSGVIEAMKVEVEEKQVFPVGDGANLFSFDRQSPKKIGLNVWVPQLDATLDDDGKLSEKFKPGDDATIPFWRPLLRSMLNVQKMTGHNGQFHGTFEVRVFARGAGETGFERIKVDEPLRTTLGFVWSTAGFTEDAFKEIQDKPIVVKVRSSNSP